MSTANKATGATNLNQEHGSNMFEGKLISMEGNQLVMTNSEGKKYSHTLAKDVKLTCDGKTCKSSDLHAGSRIRVTTLKDDRNVATCVEALEKARQFTPCN
jgi:hypothetical protein